MAKRKRERVGGSGGHGDDDDDPTYGLRQILPVANLPIDFDGEPMDGLQYLFTVRRDARRLPNIKHVDNPYACSLPQPSPSSVQPCTENTQGIKAPSSLPSTEWRSEFERCFRNLRGNISQPTIRPQQVGPFQKMMPDRKNRDAWWAFLEGAPESAWNHSRPKKHGTDRGGSWQEATQGPPPPDDDIPQMPRELSPTQLFQLDHRFSLHLVRYFTHWFNLYLESLDNGTTRDSDNNTPTYTPTDVHLRWIFALLTRIDLFCSADEISCLRSLARTCLSLISVIRRRKAGDPSVSSHDDHTDKATETDVDGTETRVTPSGGDSKTLSECSMWMVFCAVTSIWGQRDLWNDAEEALRQNL